MNNYSVSVIIPTYNRYEGTINAIRSALDQSIPPSEILVIDDGSDEEVLKSLEQKIQELKDSRIVLIKSSPKRHPGVIRNIGLDVAKSDWIAFLDSDDSWLKNKLEIQMNEMIANNCSASCTRSLNENNKSIDSKSSGNKFLKTKQLLRVNQIINSSVIVSNELLRSVGGVVSDFSVRGVEDYATWLRISSKTEWILVDKPLVVYNQDSPDSIRNDSRSTNTLDMTHAHLNFMLWRNRNLIGRVRLKILKEIIRILSRISA